MSENEWETHDMATSRMEKASNGPAKTALAVSHSQSAVQNPPIDGGPRGLNIMKDMDTCWRWAGAVVKAHMAPRSLDTQEKVFVATQMGAELGLTPMQSLKNIAVINGTPAVWGDALMALVRRSPICKSLTSRYQGDGETRVCIVTGVRNNGDVCERSFGYKDAKRAGLLAKDTYKTYPDRMYFHRAFGYVAHELFADLLLGTTIAEEVSDQAYIETAEPVLESGDDAPLDSLDDAAALLAADDHPSDATPEELADMRRELEEERRPHGDKLFETKSEFDSIPF